MQGDANVCLSTGEAAVEAAETVVLVHRMCFHFQVVFSNPHDCEKAVIRSIPTWKFVLQRSFFGKLFPGRLSVLRGRLLSQETQQQTEAEILVCISSKVAFERLPARFRGLSNSFHPFSKSLFTETCILLTQSFSNSGPKTSPTYNGGGATKYGSGPKPAYGGGRYYGGGAVQPYQSGMRSPSGIRPFALGAGIGLLAVWPAVWLYGAYMYPYHNLYTYHNQTSDQDETRNVTCACDPYNVCGCDENTNTTYIDDLIGNGSYSSLNHSLITVATVDGTDYLLINGTLPNGTTASGGTDDDDDGTTTSGGTNGGESSAAGLRRLLEHAGWWPVVATVAATVFAV